MNVRLVVRRRVDSDTDEIADYIGSHNEDAGRRFLIAALRDFQFLRKNPKAGAIRHSAKPSLKALRSWPIKGFENYLVFYLSKRTRVEMVRVLHGARDVARLFDERS